MPPPGWTGAPGSCRFGDYCHLPALGGRGRRRRAPRLRVREPRAQPDRGGHGAAALARRAAHRVAPLVDALERVVDACNRNNIAAGYLVNTVEEGALRLRQGFRCIAYGGDLWLYRRALRQGIEGLRASV